MPEIDRTMETLRCRAGHDFTRPLVRGKKPAWCPDHRPQVKKPVEALPEPLSAAPEPAPKSEQPVLSATLVKALVAETTEVLIALPDGDETRRKLQYIIRQLKSGKREAGDVKMLRETRDRLISDVRRKHGVIS
jgi:hypothetical protein